MRQGLIIRDGTDEQDAGLNFDLPEILQALGARVDDSQWRCSRLNYVSKDDRDVAVLERAAKSPPVSGSELSGGVDQLLQVIDGEFEGLDKGGRPWVLVRAVDSSWWEVWSDDSSVLSDVRKRFKLVESAG